MFLFLGARIIKIYNLNLVRSVKFQTILNNKAKEVFLKNFFPYTQHVLVFLTYLSMLYQSGAAEARREIQEVEGSWPEGTKNLLLGEENKNQWELSNTDEVNNTGCG